MHEDDSVNYCKAIISERVNQSPAAVSRRGIPGKLSEVSIIETESLRRIVLVPTKKSRVCSASALPAPKTTQLSAHHLSQWAIPEKRVSLGSIFSQALSNTFFVFDGNCADLPRLRLHSVK
jgi:hypothetical protein